jgi:hypothetical protein
LYAEIHLEKYLAQGRCMSGSRPFGDAEMVMSFLPQPGSFIQAGGDHGEPYIVSRPPRASTMSRAWEIIAIMPTSTSCFTPMSKCASSMSFVTLSKLYEAGLKSHELMGTRPTV